MAQVSPSNSRQLSRWPCTHPFRSPVEIVCFPCTRLFLGRVVLWSPETFHTPDCDPIATSDLHGDIPSSSARCNSHSVLIQQQIITTHTHTTILRPSWILSGTIHVSWHQKAKTDLDILEQEIVSGSGISWAICKSAPWPRHITTPASHNSVLYRPDALPAAQPTASKQVAKVMVPIACISTEHRSFNHICQVMHRFIPI